MKETGSRFEQFLIKKGAIIIENEFGDGHAAGFIWSIMLEQKTHSI
jgi:hypothetical protein